MAFPVWFGAISLVAAIVVVGSGIHIRVVPPAQRRMAWVTFGLLCLALVLNVAYGWLTLDLASLEAESPPVLSGWALACMVPLWILLGIIFVGFLVHDLRQAFANYTTSIHVPPEA